MQIGIIGGTGDMGFGLGLRWALAGHTIRIGSRDESKAQAAAEQARALTGIGSINGLANREAVEGVDLAVLAVPSAGHRATVESLRDRIGDRPVLDVTVPLAFGPLRYAPPAAGSNAQETRELLGESSRVAAAFHTVSASLLSDVGTRLAEETLVVGDDKDTKAMVIELAEAIGMRAFDAGPLRMAATVESLTPLLIGLNKRYGSTHIGIRLAGLAD